MSFRYINPGYAFLLDEGNTATQYDSSAPDYDPTFANEAGLCLTPDDEDGAIIHLNGYTPVDELWISFEVLCGRRTDLYITPPNYPGTKVIRIHTQQDDVEDDGKGYLFSITLGETVSLPNWRGDDLPYNLHTNEQNNTKMQVWIHTKYGTNHIGFIHLYINGEFVCQQGLNAVESSASVDYVTFKLAKVLGEASSTPISNIIISDEEISLLERVAALPMTNISTDMTDGGNGIYIANIPNQTLLQTSDTTALSSIHDGLTVVTGIRQVAYPAYRTGELLNHLTAISKYDTLTTERGTMALSTDRTEVGSNTYSLPNMTLNDLSNYQFGWKAVE